MLNHATPTYYHNPARGKTLLTFVYGNLGFVYSKRLLNSLQRRQRHEVAERAPMLRSNQSLRVIAHIERRRTVSSCSWEEGFPTSQTGGYDSREGGDGT